MYVARSNKKMPSFVEEINFKEIELFEHLGKGTYGTVRKGKWRGKDVAVKLIGTEAEQKSFAVEVAQLSRVSHPNIVKLYGASTMPFEACLVMEYAEGGSLYHVLHEAFEVKYTAAHAISWVLQCAKGVAYLHNMKPKPLVHRDLKPANLLLLEGGTLLKICDFGTACESRTYMSNNQGSASWMAPEVFKDVHYNEKCDVFSWAIILWEVLSRMKPYCYKNIKYNAYSILWTVYNGKRPPLIKGCPKPIEDLMMQCWSKNPNERPSMQKIVEDLTRISKFFKGADKPVTYSTEYIEDDEDEEENEEEIEMSFASSSASNMRETSEEKGHLAAKVEADAFLDVDASSGKEKKRHSADFSSTEIKLPAHLGHRRTGSCDSYYEKFPAPENPSTSFHNTTSQATFNPAYQELVTRYEKNLQRIRELQQQVNEKTSFLKNLSEKRKQLQSELCNSSDPDVSERLKLLEEKESMLQTRTFLIKELDALKKRKDRSGSSSEEWVVLSRADIHQRS